MLKRKFFARDTLEVARDLLGKCLVVEETDKNLVINEVEAYLGPEDLASHARFGKTKRSRVMYGAPGVMYVYLIYGMYHMLNIVTDKEGEPGAALIRGASEYEGPGVLTRECGITKSSHNGEPLGRQSGVWIEEGVEVKSEKIRRTPRIGIEYAGEWSDKSYRFLLRSR